MLPQAVIFDMDGLLVDSEPIHLQTNTLFWKRYGQQFTHNHALRFMGKRTLEEIGELSREWHMTKPIAALFAEREALFLELVRDSLTLTKGARSLLRYLKAHKVPVGLATSSPGEYVDLVMDRFAIRPYFKVIVTSEHVRLGKPNPEVYLLASQRLNVMPSSCVVLEDAVNGIAAAKAAGMVCFAIPGPFVDRSAYRHADKIFDSLADVQKHLTLT